MKIDTIIKIPDNIDIQRNPSSTSHSYKISGPLGWSSLNLSRLDKTGSSSIRVSLENRSICIRGLDSKTNVLYKKLIENKFKGVSRGFCVTLDIVGVGYRAMIIEDGCSDSTRSSKHFVEQNPFKKSFPKRLCLKVGTSHDIHYKIPNGVGIFLQSPTSVCIFGVDLNQVTQCAHSIRSTRAPSRYKSKGIRLSTEKIETKAGKR